MAGIFASGTGTASDWMTGLLSSEQVLAELGIRLGRRFRGGFLARRLDLDCARMRVNAELVEVLRALRAQAVVVIATGNMDCSARALRRSRTRRRRPHRRETLADWAVICDDLICSSDAAALKSDDPHAFFGPWPDRHGLQFAGAVLIDDRVGNCAAFTACGGAAVQWKMGTHDARAAAAQLKEWLHTRDRLLPRP
jgi:hypothetical protein